MSEAAAPAAPANTRRRRLPQMPTRTVPQYSGARAVVGISAALAFVVLLVLAERYVSMRGADTDFFPRWYGLRALLIEQRDPYTPAVTAEIVAQTSLAGAPLVARAAYGFVYPLPGALLLAPLALLPYTWAGAVWLALGLVALPASLVFAVRALAGAHDRAAERLTIPLPFVFAPALWNLALVQPGLLVVPLMALAIGLRRIYPAWAGVALACAALLKPQLSAPLAAALTLRSLLSWREPGARRMLLGLATSTVTLCALAALLLPAWPPSWLAALRDYGQVPAMEPLSSAVYRLARELSAGLGEGPAGAVTVISAVALAAWVLRAWQGGTPHPVRAIARTIVAGALLVPPAWETNALILLIPLALVQLPNRSRGWFVVACAALSVALLPLTLALPWRSGAVAIGAYVGLGLIVRRWADRSAPAPGAA